MENIIPIIATTRESLEAAAAEGCPLIYVDMALYRTRAAEIRELMAQNHYVLSRKQGRKGVFFLLTAGKNRFDHSRHRIHDPLGIL